MMSILFLNPTKSSNAHNILKKTIPIMGHPFTISTWRGVGSTDNSGHVNEKGRSHMRKGRLKLKFSNIFY